MPTMPRPMRPSVPAKPVPQVLYTGPAVPAAYEDGWGTYTNLTKEQIAAFQAFPQDLTKYALVEYARLMHELAHTEKRTAAASAKYITDTSGAAISVLNEANATPQTITTRKQIDVAYAALA